MTTTENTAPTAPAIANSGGPNWLLTIRSGDTHRVVISCAAKITEHLQARAYRGQPHFSRLGQLLDEGAWGDCEFCAQDERKKAHADLERERRLWAAGVRYHGRQGDDESGTMWFAFNDRLPEAVRPEGECDEECARDRRRDGVCYHEDVADPALLALEAIGFSLYARKCHNGDWDCCGRLFWHEPQVTRSAGWTLVRHSYGRDV